VNPARRRLLAGAAAAALQRGAFAQAPRAVEPQQVSPSAWFVQGDAALGSPQNRNSISNAGFVVTPAGVVVVDALGSPALARELIAQIRRITPQPVTHVVLTHYHADHIYGLQEFKRAGVKIIAHRLGREYLFSDTAAGRLAASRKELAPWVDEHTQLVEADQWIDAPMDLVLGGVRMLVQPVGPSHTPEDLALYLPAERVLFAGDLVFRGRIPYVGQADSRQWIRSLDVLLAMDPAVIVPGHGPASTSARQDLELTRDYLAYLRDTMGKAAADMEPFEEAYARTDWSRYAGLPLFRAANRMNAYNTYLLMEQQGR
jgi:glyoxylase-like metal-dependent hydrolase (beta-lactamase superfamily II)